MNQIIGNLDSELVEIYSDLIEREVLTHEQGGEFMVSINSGHAIKHPYYGSSNWPAKARALIREFEIGRDLRQKGVNVPEMHGVYTGSEHEMPFLVMQRLNLINLEDLNRADMTEAFAKYSEQHALARKRGYTPGDVSECANCGFDKKQREVYFYDFSDWERN